MCVCESLFVHSSTFCFDLCLCVVFVIVCRLFLLVSHAYLLILDFFNISYVLCSALYCPTAPFFICCILLCVLFLCVCVSLFLCFPPSICCSHFRIRCLYFPIVNVAIFMCCLHICFVCCVCVCVLFFPNFDKFGVSPVYVIFSGMSYLCLSVQCVSYLVSL